MAGHPYEQHAQNKAVSKHTGCQAQAQENVIN